MAANHYWVLLWGRHHVKYFLCIFSFNYQNIGRQVNCYPNVFVGEYTEVQRVDEHFQSYKACQWQTGIQLRPQDASIQGSNLHFYASWDEVSAFPIGRRTWPYKWKITKGPLSHIMLYYLITYFLLCTCLFAYLEFNLGS